MGELISLNANTDKKLAIKCWTWPGTTLSKDPIQNKTSIILAEISSLLEELKTTAFSSSLSFFSFLRIANVKVAVFEYIWSSSPAWLKIWFKKEQLKNAQSDMSQGVNTLEFFCDLHDILWAVKWIFYKECELHKYG